MGGKLGEDVTEKTPRAFLFRLTPILFQFLFQTPTVRSLWRKDCYEDEMLLLGHQARLKCLVKWSLKALFHFSLLIGNGSLTLTMFLMLIFFREKSETTNQTCFLVKNGRGGEQKSLDLAQTKPKKTRKRSSEM